MKLLRLTILLTFATACGSSKIPAKDSGQDRVDAGFRDATRMDSGAPVPDAGQQDAGIGDAEAGVPDAGPTLCNPLVGLATPARVCTPQDPCTNLSALDPPERATRPSDVPLCRTSTSAADDGRLDVDDGAPKRWIDGDGHTRYWCEYRPTGTSTDATRPLVVFFHGTAGTADDVYNFTSLRSQAQSNASPFVLVSIQGRNLHVPTIGRTDSSKHDEFHRDLSMPSANQDVAFADYVIDSLAAVTASDRIYVMGWSNGGFFAQLYAVARHGSPTEGGRRVAAAAVYSAGDPFHEIVPGENCRLDPYPQSPLPVMILSRSCDLIACDEAQAADLRTQGTAVPPGRVVGTWIVDAQNRVGATVEWRLISGVFEGAGRVVNSCSSNCPTNRATLNHIRWPDGVADGSGRDHEPAMLDFLFTNPLP